VFELLHDADRLSIVIESAFHELVQRGLSRVPESRVPEVWTEADGLGEDLVEAKRLRNRPPDLRHFQDVSETRSVVIAFRREEDLRLVLEASECFAVDDAVAVALIRRPQIVFRLGAIAPARL